MKKLKITLLLLGLFLGLCLLVFSHRTVAYQVPSPTGKYTATVSCRTILSLVPAMPGHGGDKPCFVRITGQDGTDYGEIPVPMLYLAKIEWTDGGASIRLIGEWDFAKKTCYYWSEDGLRQIYVKGGL